MLTKLRMVIMIISIIVTGREQSFRENSGKKQIIRFIQQAALSAQCKPFSQLCKWLSARSRPRGERTSSGFCWKDGRRWANDHRDYDILITDCKHLLPNYDIRTHSQGERCPSGSRATGTYHKHDGCIINLSPSVVIIIVLSALVAFSRSPASEWGQMNEVSIIRYSRTFAGLSIVSIILARSGTRCRWNGSLRIPPSRTCGSTVCACNRSVDDPSSS